MLKSLVIVSSAAVLLAMAPGFSSGAVAQEAAPAQAAAPEATPPAPVKGPMALDAKNPVTPTAANMAEAKAVYSRDCALCHGDNGNGKSDLATSMQLTMGDWTDSKTLAGQKDGELFNVIRVGIGDGQKMPGENAGRAKDAVVWNMIYYIRNFSKVQAVVPASAVRNPAAQTSNR